MARIRYLKPEFFKDDDMASLPFETRLFYQGLWTQADKAGRLEDRPKRLKAEIFPYDDVDVEKCLKQLCEEKKGSHTPFINRYATDGQRYIQIIKWDEHQKPHHTEAESKIPPAPFERKEAKERTKGKGKGNGEGKAAQPESSVKQPLNNGYQTVTSYTIEQVKDACILLGIPEQNAQSYFDHYGSQGWKKANSQLITELRGHMKKRWMGKGWDFDEKMKGKEIQKDLSPPVVRDAEGKTPADRARERIEALRRAADGE